jgi:hypothetical protein
MSFGRKDVVVVLGCVVFLLATLGAVGSSGRRRAKEAVCLSNLRQWGTVFRAFLQDNNGYFDTGWPHSAAEDGFYAGGHHWPIILQEYYRDRKLRFCPMATVSITSQPHAAFWAWPRMDTLDQNRYYDPEGSYGKNEWAANQSEELQRIPGANWRTPNVQGANNIPLLMDCAWAGGFPEDFDVPPAYDGEMDLLDREMRRLCINRHEGTVNCVFLDFSARKVGLKELWTLKWHRQYDTEGPWTTAGGVEPDDWPEWMRDFEDY